MDRNKRDWIFRGPTPILAALILGLVLFLCVLLHLRTLKGHTLEHMRRLGQQIAHDILKQVEERVAPFAEAQEKIELLQAKLAQADPDQQDQILKILDRYQGMYKGQLSALRLYLEQVTFGPLVRGVELFLNREGNWIPLMSHTSLLLSEDLEAVRQGPICRVLRDTDSLNTSLYLPIPYKGSPLLGILHLDLNLPEGVAPLTTSLPFIIGIIAIGVSLALVTLIYIHTAFTLPVQRLVDGIKAVSEGKARRVVMPVASQQIGWLSLKFHQLIRQISKFHEELQHRVAEATRELRERNLELEKANERLFHLQGQLARAERLASLGHLSATLAHEIGTTLNVLSGHLQLLGRLTDKDPRLKRHLDIIDLQLERLIHTVKEVLKTRRLPEPKREPLQLNSLLTELTPFVQPTLAASRIRLSLQLDENLPELSADRYQLQQAFLNILHNAVEAMPEGGDLSVQTFQRDAAILVRFTDTGVGISPENIDKIFDPFFSTKPAEDGKGMGLTITQQIIQNHGGTVSVKSELSKGTTFEITLPLSDTL